MDYSPSVDLGSVFSPNVREVSIFFLGGAFWCSLQCLATSPLLRTLARRLDTVFRFSSIANRPEIPVSDPEAQEKPTIPGSAITPLTEAHLREDRSTLIFILSFCFVLASLGDFLSLITYGAGADTACAFVIAWGDMSAHSGRLVGLFILRQELRSLGIRTWEYMLFLGWLLIGVGLIFATNAINIGMINPIRPLRAFTCTRNLFLPIALTSVIFHIVFDFYVIFRLSTLIMKRSAGLPSRQGLKGLFERRVAQALSLLALEIMAAPTALSDKDVPNFIPTSIGFLLVLLAYHYRSAVARVAILGSPLSSPAPRIYLSPLKAPSLAPVLPPVSLYSNPSSTRGLPANEGRGISSMDSLASDRIPYDATGRRAVLPSPPGIGPQETLGTRAGKEKMELQPVVQRDLINRQILSSQVEFARQFEQDAPPGPLVPNRRRPQISIAVSPTWDRDDVSHVGSTRTLSSAVLGSDIIRYTPSTAKPKRDRTKRWSVGSRFSTRSSPRDSMSTSASSVAQLYSAVSPRGMATQELPVVYEAGARRGSQSSSVVPGSGRRRTFGNQSLRRVASRLAAPALSSGRRSPLGLPAQPRLAPDGSQRDSFGAIRGPRPPPLSSARSLQRAARQGDAESVRSTRPRSESLPEHLEGSRAGSDAGDWAVPAAY